MRNTDTVDSNPIFNTPGANSRNKFRISLRPLLRLAPMLAYFAPLVVTIMYYCHEPGPEAVLEDEFLLATLCR